MVLMSAGKAARNQAAICNRTNTCGGPSKGGLAPTQGWFMQSNPNGIRGTNTMFGLKCIPNRTTQTQAVGYSAVHGGNR